MRSVRQRDTSPEMLVRRAAHAMGARYRVSKKSLPGSPDLVFASRKLCLFVHGCFWHRHAGCRLSSTPSTNVKFWEEKFSRNVERDARKARELIALGWQVEVIWECEARKSELLSRKLKCILFSEGLDKH